MCLTTTVVRNYSLKPNVKDGLMEVWGNNPWYELENLHLQACKYTLCMHQSMPTDGVYVELGRYLLYVYRKISIMKYLKRLEGTVAHKAQCNKKWFAANKKDRMQTKKIMQTKKTGCKPRGVSELTDRWGCTILALEVDRKI